MNQLTKKKRSIAKSEHLKDGLRGKPVQCYMKDVSLFYRDGRLRMHAKTHQKDMRIRAYCRKQGFKSTGNYYNSEPSVILSFQRPMQKIGYEEALPRVLLEPTCDATSGKEGIAG